MNRNTAATFTHNTGTQNNGTHSNASRLTNLGIGLMIILSVAIGLYAIAFQTGILGSPEIQAKFAEWPVFSSMHIIGGAVVIITGGFQFWPKLRTDHINFHRWLGRWRPCDRTEIRWRPCCPLWFWHASGRLAIQRLAGLH